MSQQFHIYGYQILPIAQRQLSLFDAPISLDELKEKKNQYFVEALLRITEFKYGSHQTNHRTLYQGNDLVVMQIALNRGIVKQEKPDFTEERYQNYPSFLIGFNNNPNVQRILIEREYKAFRDTYLARKMIPDNINRVLESYMLHAEISPIFDSNDF